MKQFKIKQKKQKVGFLGLLLGTLGVSLIGNLLAGKRINWTGEGTTNLTNFEIKRHYQNEPKFNGAYSRINLPIVKMLKEVAYVINLDGYKLIGTHCIALYANDTNLVYFIVWELNKL